jgi:hypothetical protein
MIGIYTRQSLRREMDINGYKKPKGVQKEEKKSTFVGFDLGKIIN